LEEKATKRVAWERVRKVSYNVMAKVSLLILFLALTFSSCFAQGGITLMALVK